MDDAPEGNENDLSAWSEEDISRWAANVSPDGAPGTMSQRMREFLGDQGYEKAVAQNDAVAALYLQRQTAINKILTVIAVYGSLLAFVALVASVAFVIKYIF